MATKECFKCHEVLPLSAFYRHARMGDGHLNKCKECTKRDVSTHRRKHLEQHREYDRSRRDSLMRRLHQLRSTRRQRKRFPEKERAHAAVARAVRSGKLVRGPCEVCGTTVKVQGHHDDYGKPLAVRWLCVRHHYEAEGRLCQPITEEQSA